MRGLNSLMSYYDSYLVEFRTAPALAPLYIHYWIQAALDKALNTLGKGFAECRTRQRAVGKKPVGKGFFAECHISGTR